MKPDPAFPRDPPAEDTFAGIAGIDQVLADGPVRINAEMRHKAERLRPTMDAELRKFMKRATLEGERDLPDFDYKEKLRQLTELDAQARMAALAAPLGGEDPGLLVIAGRALQYLKGIVPARSRATILGPVDVLPSDYQRYKFTRAYSVIRDPLTVFRDMNEGNLSRDQVRTMQVIYPSLYEDAEKVTFEIMAEMKADNPKLEFTRDKVRQIENLWLTRSWNPELARTMQAAFDQKPPPDQKPAPLGNSNDDPSLTPIQRAESK